MIRKVLYIIVFILSCNTGNSQVLRVGMYNDVNTKSVVFTAINTNYLLQADNRAILTIKPQQNIYISKTQDSLHCTIANKDLGYFKSIRFNSMSDSGTFSLRVVDPQTNLRYYDDNLELCSSLGKLQSVNIVDIDKYIAGVVESEGGFNASLEYYKTQAVLCRTYALGHLDRHNEEGFYLCDGVHCQAFNGKSAGTISILKAAYETRGLVVTDPDSVFITASFHSDCGGETESAQNVWLIKKPYLKPVQDPYCQNQHNYRWERKITIEKWKDYLQSNGFKLKPDFAPSYFNFTQYKRKQYYKIGTDSTTFRKIRSDFVFPSAFFSIEAKDGNLEIHGRGYGHGVGLCQEGAMQMSKLGYNFREIIQFYYQGVNVSEYKRASMLKNPSLNLLSNLKNHM
jgi:stage II sporulation protein D